MTIFRCKLGLGKCFGTSSQSNCWAGHWWLSHKIHFSLHITIHSRNGSLLLCIIKEDGTSKPRFFLFWSVHGTPTYQDFTFQFVSLWMFFKMPYFIKLKHCVMLSSSSFSWFMLGILCGSFPPFWVNQFVSVSCWSLLSVSICDKLASEWI